MNCVLRQLVPEISAKIDFSHEWKRPWICVAQLLQKMSTRIAKGPEASLGYEDPQCTRSSRMALPTLHRDRFPLVSAMRSLGLDPRVGDCWRAGSAVASQNRSHTRQFESFTNHNRERESVEAVSAFTELTASPQLLIIPATIILIEGMLGHGKQDGKHPGSCWQVGHFLATGTGPGSSDIRHRSVGGVCAHIRTRHIKCAWRVSYGTPPTRRRPSAQVQTCADHVPVRTIWAISCFT